MTFKFHKSLILFTVIISVANSGLEAQTDIDAIMMSKKNLCSGIIYSHTNWTNYWEGTQKRVNANLGTVSSNNYSVMANYGFNNHLNIIAELPYVETKASGGQLHPMKGLQDFSLWAKWEAFEKSLGKGVLSVFGVGGFSSPSSNYPADFLPLSIGLGSTNVYMRVITDYQVSDFFVTASATYIHRKNIRIDKPAYYTTEMHFTNEVQMPDAAQYNLRGGLRNNRWIAEIVANNWTTLGGFDITKNNMPFPSNKMNMTTLGARVPQKLVGGCTDRSAEKRGAEIDPEAVEVPRGERRPE